ncbi:MAG: hypothetical protein KJ006_00005 [Thermoleophilia bacterium]|nr:hypothetical protein [Thermoleophilia bacterium]
MPEAEAIPLSDEDRAILALECAAIAGHTCKVVALGGDGIAVEALRERIGSRLAATPELTRRLGGTSERPAWVPAPGFDLADHVRASPVRLTGPARSDDLVPAEVARLFEQRLDRDRPLWAIDVVPCPAGGSVLVWRIHHALADGTAAMRFARALLWDADSERPATPVARSGEHPDHERRRAHLAAFIEREFAGSLQRSPFDGMVGSRRRVAFASAPLKALHDAAKRLASATINDAVLAAVSGSLRRWIEDRHGPLGDVRVRVPVSLHREGDDAANRDSFFTVRLPLAVADPVERLRVIERETAARKQAGDAERIESPPGLSPASGGTRRPLRPLGPGAGAVRAPHTPRSLTC